MTFLEEEKIHFIGKNSYKENDSSPADKEFLIKFIDEIKKIIDIKINNKILPSRLEKELEINNEDPNLRFSLTYSDYDLYPDESVMNIGLEIQENINKLFDIYETSYKKYSNFYYAFYPNWNGSDLSLSLFVRPYRGYFTCPICENKIEDSEVNDISDVLLNEDIACCQNANHKTFFVENFIDNEFEPEKPLEINDNLKIHIIDPNQRVHRLLAFQFKVIAKHEYSSFLNPNLCDSENNPKMYVLTEREIPVGYIYWNDFDNNIRCFRQIFIRKKFRRKGFGTILTEKTVEIECGKEKKFIVETPNEKSGGILLKLGYATENDNKLIGIRCSFAQSF